MTRRACGAIYTLTQAAAYVIDDDRTDWETDLAGLMIVNDPFDNTIPDAANIALFCLGVAGIGYQRRRRLIA